MSLGTPYHHLVAHPTSTLSFPLHFPSLALTSGDRVLQEDVLTRPFPYDWTHVHIDEGSYAEFGYLPGTDNDITCRWKDVICNAALNNTIRKALHNLIDRAGERSESADSQSYGGRTSKSKPNVNPQYRDAGL